MPKFFVTYIVDATHTVQVDALNEEDAKNKADEIAHCPSLCHQCSNHIELGDLQDITEVGEV